MVWFQKNFAQIQATNDKTESILGQTPDDQKLVTMGAHQHHRQRLVLGFLTGVPGVVSGSRGGE